MRRLAAVLFVAGFAAAAARQAAAAPAAAADRSLQIRLDAVASDPNEPRNYYNLGIEYYNRDMLDPAVESFQKALKTNKGNHEAHDQIDLDCCQILANIMMTKKEFGDAVDWFEKGLKIKPDDPACLFGRGEAYYKNNKVSAARKALAQYLDAAKANPKGAEQMPQALNYLGAMSMAQKKYDEAAGYFRQVLQQYPKQSREAASNLALVSLTVGDAALKKKDLAAAVKSYDEAVGAAPDAAAGDPADVQEQVKNLKTSVLRSSARTHFEIAKNLAASKADADKKAAPDHFRTAEANFNRALALDPNDFESAYFAGLSEYNLEKFDEMVNSYQTAVKINPNHAGALYNLALAQLRKSLFEDAMATADHAKTIDKEDKDIPPLIQKIFDSWIDDLNKKAMEAFTADRFNDAIASWEKVQQLDAHNPDAAQYLETARAKLKEQIEMHTTRGDKFSEEGNIAGALEEWNAALALDPTNQALADKMKKIGVAKRADAIAKQAADLFAQGDLTEAMAKVTEALSIAPKNAKARALKNKILVTQNSGFKKFLTDGERLLKSGKLIAAKREFEKARDVEPGNKRVGTDLQIVAKRIDDAIQRGMADGTEGIRSGNKDAARKAFEAVLALDPANKEAADNIKKLTGKESSTKVSAEKAKELYKQGINAYLVSRLADAEKAWSEALKYDPDNAEIKRYLDRVRLKLRKGGAAA